MPVRIDHKPKNEKDRAYRMSLKARRLGKNADEVHASVEDEIAAAKNLDELKAVLAKFLPGAVIKQLT